MVFGLRKISGKLPWLSGKDLRREEASAPKYPPVAAGIPAVPVEEILRPHEDLLARINHLVEQEAAWGKWYLPLIRRYATFVHLLPASEYHHHRGAGGLLTHGLEVGLYTMQRAHDKLYGMKLEPRVRRLARPRWQYGCFVAGLCHDVAKPVTLLRVMLEPAGGNLTDWDDRCWQPFGQDLLTWCREKGAQRYWVAFRKRQERDHERLAALALDRVLTSADRAYLTEYDSEMLLNVMATIQKEADVGHDMGKLVLAADRRSVQEDLGKSNLAQDLGQEVALPVMRIVSDAMRRLVRDDVWRVNVPGGRLWYQESGLYLVWPEGGKDIGLLLDRDEAYRGVPRNPQTLAEIMLEWRFIEPTAAGSPFWWISLEGVSQRLLALKIREPRGLVEVLPAPCSGGVEPYEAGQQQEHGTEGQEESEDTEIASAGNVEVAGGSSLAVSEQSKPDQDNQVERPSVLARVWSLLRGCLGGTGRFLWDCVPGGVRGRLAGWKQSERAQMGEYLVAGTPEDMLLALSHLKEAVACLRSAVAEQGKQMAMLIELCEVLIQAGEPRSEEGYVLSRQDRTH